MPSLKMKSKISAGCLRERKDLHVCSKSTIICKKPCSKTINSAQVAELDTTTQNCLDVSSRTEVSSKDIESGDSIDNVDDKEFLDKDNSELKCQQSFSIGSSALGRMESTNSCTANIETIFSPAFEPIEVHCQEYTDNDAGSSSDTDMVELEADDSKEGRSICSHETCGVSDFYIFDMIIVDTQFCPEPNTII